MERLRRKQERKKANRLGGVTRAELRYRKYREAARVADHELNMYRIGEPSFGFFPVDSQQELDGEVTVFSESIREETTVYQSRSADVAKRRAVIINGFLEDPESYDIPRSNLNFVQRHFGRILRFARTLKNKGRLNPVIEDILEV